MDIGPIFRAMRRNKLRFGLVVFEIALTLAIVANCVTMILDARSKMTRLSGFDDENLVMVRSTPFDPAFKEDGYLDNAVKQDLDVLRGLPGVRAATNTRFIPWQGGGSSTEVRPAGATGDMMRTQIYTADEKTFDALGVSVVEGRAFTRDEWERDALRLRALNNSVREKGQDGRPKDKFTQDVVISQALGKLAFGEGTSFLGKALEDSDGDLYRVIGVIDNFYNPYGWPIHEYVVFYPNMSRSYNGGAAFLVRAEPGRAGAITKALEERLLAANGGRNITVRTLEDVKSQFFVGQRITVTAMTSVVVLLVFVTSLGIVGLASFSVTERTRQIGTRRALGARKQDILRHFLLENWLLTTMGLAFGILFAYGLNFGLVSIVQDAKLQWPLVAGGVLFLWTAGLLATLGPALRASRIAPALATRNV
jgi:putative ABC transport system permease protein